MPGWITPVVVNHNTRRHLRRCLRGLAGEPALRTLLVDTGSTDGSVEMVRSEFPGVQIHVMENRGFGAACNLGLAATADPYVLLLNSDTVVEHGTLQSLAAYLDSHERVAIVGPRIVSEDGTVEETARAFPTPLHVLLQQSGLHRVARPCHQTPDQAAPVDWVLGAALATRRASLDAVGGFDEAYFMYGEEIDLCLRLRRAGWEVHYAPVATVTHASGASTKQQPAAMLAEYVRSMTLLYRKHLPPRKLFELKVVLGGALAAKVVRDSLRAKVARVETQASIERDLEAWRAGIAALRRPEVAPTH